MTKNIPVKHTGQTFAKAQIISLHHTVGKKSQMFVR